MFVIGKSIYWSLIGHCEAGDVEYPRMVKIGNGMGMVMVVWFDETSST